jgi:tRNA/tmRNA/rRNA uracil-C5-methylase (TrmA/RlmC/RlmD family)
MSKLATVGIETVSDKFHRYNDERAQRTFQLTEQAITKLQATNQKVTLAAITAMTTTLDRQGKGLTPATILRNPRSRELFQKHSPVYQARQKHMRRVKRRRGRTNVSAELRAIYGGLRIPELIQLAEDLKQQISELKTHTSKLQQERDEAYRQRNAALLQNAKQLASLTQVQTQSALQLRQNEPSS